MIPVISTVVPSLTLVVHKISNNMLVTTLHRQLYKLRTDDDPIPQLCSLPPNPAWLNEQFHQIQPTHLSGDSDRQRSLNARVRLMFKEKL